MNDIDIVYDVPILNEMLFKENIKYELNNNEECCICLNEINDLSNGIIQLKCCNNYIHKKCVIKWIFTILKTGQNFTNLCPLCRSYNNHIEFFHNKIKRKYFDLSTNETLITISSDIQPYNPRRSYHGLFFNSLCVYCIYNNTFINCKKCITYYFHFLIFIFVLSIIYFYNIT